MADDILGHDHLDHGKHLHRDHGHGHGHDKKHGHGDHHSKHHIGLLRRHSKQTPASHDHPAEETGTFHDWRKWAIAGVVAIPLIFMLYKSVTGLAIALGILVANTLIEYHKMFTSGTNLDFEILSVGVAYIAAAHSILWAIILALTGPVVAEVSRSYFSEKSFFKSASLLVTAVAGMLLGTSPWQLFTAVVFGLLAYYIINMVTSDIGPAQNMISRVSTAIFSAYILFLLLPRFL